MIGDAVAETRRLRPVEEDDMVFLGFNARWEGYPVCEASLSGSLASSIDIEGRRCSVLSVCHSGAVMALVDVS